MVRLAGRAGRARNSRRTNYLGVLRRYKVTVAAILVVVVGSSLAITLAERPTYQAEAKIVVAPGGPAVGAALTTQPTDPVRALGSEVQILTGPIVRAEVERMLGPTPSISATGEADANIIRIAAKNGRPDRAAAIANAYASAYLKVRMETAATAVAAASRPIQSRIRDLQSQIDLATGQQQAGLISSQAVFEKELSQLQVDNELRNAETRLLSAAAEPHSPIHPNPARTVAWALAVGLSLGVAAAFYRDYRDDSIRSHDDLEADFGQLLLAGVIPLTTGRAADLPVAGLTSEPGSESIEAYQTLQNMIRSQGLDSGGSVVQITSPAQGEGKTTIVANLGALIAQGGRRVAIVCCDLRRPEIHHLLNLENETGLTSVIMREVPLNDALRLVPGQPGLIALTAGPIPPNPSELLSSSRTAHLFRSLQAEVDIVLVDCPPVLTVTDSVVISARADATLLVCRAGVTTHRQLRRALETLELGGAPVAGVILNGADPRNDEAGRERRVGQKRSPQLVGSGRTVTD